MTAAVRENSEIWSPYIERYRRGEWRDTILRDMLFEDARRLGVRPTILDIGCGRGFDGNESLQRSIAELAGSYIGIEPDPEIALPPYFNEMHRCLFEEAPIQPGSVDLAFAVMVLEHIPAPGPFWRKLADVLREGGVFWGLTVDARHLFARLSRLADRARLKRGYLNLILGRRGIDRYEDYPVFYRTNTPAEVRRLAVDFRSLDFINFSRVGQWSPYLPGPVRPLADLWDRHAIGRGSPGTLLAIRATR